MTLIRTTSRAPGCLAFASLLATGCMSVPFPQSSASVPVLLGPVDRIGGKAAPREEPDPTIEVQDEESHGTTGHTFEHNKIFMQLLPYPSNRYESVHVSRLGTGTYVFWSIPYLTPVLWRQHWLKLEATPGGATPAVATKVVAQ